VELETEKRLWVALALSVVVIVGYSLWMQRYAPSPPRPESRPRRETAATAAPPRAEKAEEWTAPAARSATAAVRDGKTAEHSLSEFAGEEVVLENDDVRVVVSTAGGRIVSWQLKGYRATGTTVYEELVPLRAGRLGRGAGYAGPLCVRLSDFPDSTRWPAEANLAYLKVGETGIEQRMPGRGGETVVVPSTGRADTEGELVLTQRLPQGRKLTKRIYLPATGFLARIVVELTGPLPEFLEIMWYPGVGFSPDEEETMNRTETYWNMASAVVLNMDDRFNVKEGSKRRRKEKPDPFWAAVRNKYFVAAFLPAGDPEDGGGIRPAGFAASDGVHDQQFRMFSVRKGPMSRETISPDNLSAGLKFLLPRGDGPFRFATGLYVGPQQYVTLKAVGQRLEKALDLGFFAFIALPRMQVLRFIHDTVVHNYGVAIILLTILVKAALWMPSQWGMNQMKKLKDVAPQMKFIGEQFKDDPKRKQEEMMRLYKEHKVNPVGGCLPLLLQLPIFFALFTVLRTSIELRGAGFALWITDLSTRDPYFVLPVLVGVTMFLQQRMTPAMGDPSQQKMMKWMSLIFCVIFAWMPAGFLLYFLIQNFAQIGQQWYTNRQPARSPTGG